MRPSWAIKWAREVPSKKTHRAKTQQARVLTSFFQTKVNGSTSTLGSVDRVCWCSQRPASSILTALPFARPATTQPGTQCRCAWRGPHRRPHRPAKPLLEEAEVGAEEVAPPDVEPRAKKLPPASEDDWELLFEGVIEAPLARRAWTEWLPLRRAEQEPVQVAPTTCQRPAQDAPLEDLLHLLLHAVPGRRIDVKATIDTVGELEVQDLRLQPGESTASRTLNLRLRDGSVCEWRLWGGSAEKHGRDLLGQQVIVRGARPTKFNRKCLLNGCSGVEVCR